MCHRGSWRSVSTEWIDTVLCAIQQCTECGSHRALSIADCPVEGLSDDTSTDSGGRQGEDERQERSRPSQRNSWAGDGADSGQDLDEQF